MSYMRYSTKLTEEILNSTCAKLMLGLVSDKYGSSYVGLHIYNALGLVLDEILEFAESIKLQTTPQTATWGLPYWERSLKLPANDDWQIDTENRRRAAVSARWNRNAMPPDKLAEIISSKIGVNVRIVERTGKNQFMVYVSSIPRLIDETIIRNTLNKLKPSNLVYIIKYEQYAIGEIFVGGCVQAGGEITLKQR